MVVPVLRQVLLAVVLVEGNLRTEQWIAARRLVVVVLHEVLERAEAARRRQSAAHFGYQIGHLLVIDQQRTEFSVGLPVP